MHCNHFLPLPLLVSLAFHAVGAQAVPRGKAELDAAIAATRAAVQAHCPHPAPDDRGALLRDERRRSEEVLTTVAVITWHSLATFIHRTLARWGITSPAHEVDGYLHTWQVTAHFLGVNHVLLRLSWFRCVRNGYRRFHSLGRS